jgi:hypothetical protein
LRVHGLGFGVGGEPRHYERGGRPAVSESSIVHQPSQVAQKVPWNVFNFTLPRKMCHLMGGVCILSSNQCIRWQQLQMDAQIRHFRFPDLPTPTQNLTRRKVFCDRSIWFAWAFLVLRDWHHAGLEGGGSKVIFSGGNWSNSFFKAF